jgi:hypothetical protein
LNLAPRSLAVKLKKVKDGLQNHRVHVQHKKLHGRHIISLSTTVDFTQNLTKGVTPTHSTCEEGVANIVFPFSWRFCIIEELSEEEKRELNRPILNGTRKRHYLHCSICGNGGEGVLEYRKESQGTTCLLCKTCAEDYVRKAIALMQNLEGCE